MPDRPARTTWNFLSGFVSMDAFLRLALHMRESIECTTIGSITMGAKQTGGHLMAAWHVLEPIVYGRTGDVGDDGRLWLELGGIGTKGLVPQWPQDRSQCLRRPDEG